MDNLLEYKGYYGTVEFSVKDGLLYGKIKDISSLISYEGESIENLKSNFISAVDVYLEMCNDNDIRHEKSNLGDSYMSSADKILKNKLEREIDNGDLESKIQWANLHLIDYPEHIKSDPVIEKIIEYYEEGVSQDDDIACVNLGSIYYSGVYVECNFEKAIELYTKSAELGNPQAMCNLGYCFYYGRSIEVNYQKAFEWFLLATLNENINSTYKLGDMYLDDNYLPKNPKMAYELYLKSYHNYYEDNNYFQADITYRLAKCLFYGIGTNIDILESYRFIQLSEYNYYLKVKRRKEYYSKNLLRRTQKLKDEIKEQIENSICDII